MKLLLIADKLSYSNAAIYTLELVRGLLAAGHELQVAVHGGPLIRRLTELGVEHYPVKHNHFSRRKMLQFMREFEPDVVHATGGCLALATGEWVAKKLDLPLVHTLHSWLPEDQGQRYSTQLRGIVAVNEGLREHLVNESDVPKDAIRVIPYGVDLTECSEREARDPGKIPVVGTTGRLDRGRRHNEFLHAARQVVDRGIPAHFVVAGEGPDEARLRKLARQLELGQHVTFVQPQDSVDIFQILDVLVIVTDWGGVGLNLLESMKHRCPVIATGGSEIFTLLKDERIVVLVPAADQDALATQIAELLADPEQRAALAEQAFAYVRMNHPIQSHVHAIEDFYQESIAYESRR